MTGDKNVWLLNKFLDELRTMTAKARRIFGEVLDYTTGATDSSTTEGDRDLRVSKKDKRDKKKKETKRDKTKGDSPKNQKSSKSPSSVRKRCTHCNSNRHESDKCSFVDHPDFIKSGAWSDSDIGQAYVLLDPKSPYLIEGRHLSDDMSKFIYPKKTPKTPAKPKGKPVKSGNVMACCSDCAESTPSVPDKPLDDVLVPVTLLHRQAKDRSVTALALLDTGARYTKRDATEELNVISRKVVRRIVEVGGVLYDNPATLCGFGASCKTYKQAVDLNVSLLFDPANDDIVEMGNLTFQVADQLPNSEVLIGWQTLKNHRIICRCTNSIASKIVAPLKKVLSYSQFKFARPNVLAEDKSETASVDDHTDTESVSSAVPSAQFPRQGTVCAINSSNAINQRGPTSTRHISDIFNYTPDSDGKPEKEDALDEALQPDFQSQEDDTLPTDIVGSRALRRQLSIILAKYSAQFRKTVQKDPASIPPMVLNVNKKLWQSSKQNTGRYRPQSLKKHQEIDRQIQLLLELGVIRRSKSPYHSHVHLVPKPGDKWRFCLDFRFLNSCTDMEGGVIPNIAETLQRIGSKTPKFFGVIDFTSGYHQAPIAEESIPYTAFITRRGKYEWVRVPMGLKGAPSYFQREIATRVLAGYLGDFCELYLDDLIVFAETEEEFADNVDKILDRLREYNITCNPEKCRFGHTSVEYLGHVIDADGISFSEEKKNEVRNFPQPKFLKELQSFLGLVNYFGDHLRNLAIECAGLRMLLRSATKKKKLDWLPEHTEQFNKIKDMIDNLPKLHFINPDGEVVVYTDASEYGVGAYICQMVDGNEQPVAFMSKSLTATEQRWTTIEQECYAIYLCFRKYEYLLRDIKFTLKTDHANLLYINVPPSSKVLRWKLAIQEYNFDAAHVPGLQNVVADSFSRLVEAKKVPLADVLALRRRKGGGKSTDSVLEDLRLPDDVYDTIARVHNSWMGHRGIDATVKLLQDEGVSWKNIRKDVAAFIQQCPSCQKSNVRKVAYNTIPFTTATSKPHERINIDSFHVSTEDAEGFTACLVVIDTCTRWVEIYPVQNLKAESIAPRLLEYFGRFGPPTEILSDQGTEFSNALMKAMLRAVEVIHTVTEIAHSHEQNAKVERANKEVKRHLIAYCQDNNIRTNWSRAIPAVQYIINTTPNSSTGYTPFDLLFGPAVNPNRLRLSSSKSKDTSNPNTKNKVSWWDEQSELHEAILQKALELQADLDAQHLEERSEYQSTFEVGDYVLVAYPDTMYTGKGKPPTKLMPIRKGPMKVLEINKDAYTVLDIVSRRTNVVHISRLYPFFYDDTRIDPENIALRDSEEYVVESILDDTIDQKIPKKQWQFRVRWKGYDEDEDTWNSWDSLKHVEAMHEYLRKAGLQQYIPLSHQIPSDKKRKIRSEIRIENNDSSTETSTKKKKTKRQSS